MKRLLFLCVALLFPLAAGAADLTISAQVDKNTVALDDQLVLQVNVSGSGNIPNPQLPDLANFTSYSSGRSQSISIINGKMSSQVSFNYVLVPRTTGKFTIGAVTLPHEGRTYQTQPIPVEVIPAGKGPAGRASQAAPGAGPGQVPDGGNRNLFVTATLDKTAAYVSEQVIYTFRFYRNVRLLSNPNYQPPNLSGFWTEDMPPKNFYATVDGQQYMVSEVKTVLFPTKAGAFDLGRAALQCHIEDFNPADPFSDDFFRGFFSGGKAQTVQSKSLSLNVLPLPEGGKPAGFNGAVGSFRVAASLDKRSVKAGEPVTLTLTVSGTGNIKTLPEPKLPDWPDFRKYETASSLNVSKDGDVLKGSKDFKTIIVPLTPGVKTIQPLVFSFFDPAAKKYRTETTAALSLEVKPGAVSAQTAPAQPQDGQASGVKIVNRDISYLKTLRAWPAAPSGPLYANPVFIAFNALPVLFLGFLFGYRKRQERLSRDVAFARRLRASGVARRYLKQAKSLLKPNASHEFYAALERSLLEYIAGKLNVSPVGLTTAAIEKMLLAREVNADTIAAIRTAIDECGFARYAPAAVSMDMMERSYAAGDELIGRLEKELK